MSAVGLAITDLRIDRREGGTVVDGVTLSVERGATVALVGESGSGKSVTALAALGLLPRALVRAGGAIELGGRSLVEERDFAAVRGRGLALVVQDPLAGLDPFTPVGDLVALAARATARGGAAARSRARDCLERVGLDATLHRARPDELSGGQRQRALIAMSLVNGPEILVADEPTSSLDVTVQGHVLALLRRLRDESGLGLLLVTHDDRVVRAMADVVYAMAPGGPTRREEVAP